MAKKISTQYDHLKIPIIGLVAETASSAPSSPANGQLYYDTVATRLFVRENGAWVLASQTGAELLANKGATNGYAALVSGTVPIAQIPTGTTGTTVPFGNDARFTDTRTPTAGSVVPASFNASAIDAATNVASARTLAFTALAAMPGNARLDQIGAPTSAVNANSQKIVSVANGTVSGDAVNLGQLQAAMAGITGVKDPVRVAVSTNVNLAAPGASLDGVAMVAGDRFLAPAQTTTTQKGIYIWNGAAVAATRSLDADAAGEILDGTLVAVSEGTDAGKQYIQTATPAGAPGAWSQVWTIYTTGGVTYVGTAGSILLTGNAFSIDPAYVGQTSLTTLGTITTGTWSGTTIAVNKGGTGATTAAGARTNLGAPGKYAQDLTALTAGVEQNVVHSLNTLDTVESFKIAVDGTKTELAVRTIDANTIGVTSDVAYANAAIRITVLG